MKYDAALDVSVRKCAVCVLDHDEGTVVLETVVPTDPHAIVATLKPFLKGMRLVGHETGSVAPWLHREIETLGLPMVLLEARHAAAALKAQRNKTDKKDARGLAQLVRSGWFKPVHIKSEASHRLKLLLNGRARRPKTRGYSPEARSSSPRLPRCSQRCFRFRWTAIRRSA